MTGCASRLARGPRWVLGLDSARVLLEGATQRCPDASVLHCVLGSAAAQVLQGLQHERIITLRDTQSIEVGRCMLALPGCVCYRWVC
jgi:hypothetical protein